MTKHRFTESDGTTTLPVEAKNPDAAAVQYANAMDILFGRRKKRQVVDVAADGHVWPYLLRWNSGHWEATNLEADEK